MAGRNRVRVPSPESAEGALALAVRRYVDERECPAPDMTMRRVYFNQLKSALRRYEDEMELRSK